MGENAALAEIAALAGMLRCLRMLRWANNLKARWVLPITGASGKRRSTNYGEYRMNGVDSSAIEPEVPDQEKRQFWLLVARLFTFAVIALQAVTAPFVSDNGPSLIGFAFISANLSLAAIVPIWCAAVRRWLFLFVVLGVLVLVIDGVVLAGLVGRGASAIVFLLPSLIAGTVAIPLVLISCLFGRFETPAAVSAEDQEFQEGLRFRISHLMIASAGVAVLCGIGKAVAPYVDFSGARVWPIILCIVSVISFNALISVWALMGTRVGWRIGISSILFVLTSAGGLYCLWRREHDWMFLLLFGLSWLATTILLVLLRRSGLRFIKKQANPKIARSL